MTDENKAVDTNEEQLEQFQILAIRESLSKIETRLKLINKLRDRGMTNEEILVILNTTAEAIVFDEFIYKTICTNIQTAAESEEEIETE